MLKAKTPLSTPTASERIRALRDVEARRKAIEAQRQRAAIRRSVERG
jgi:hypothetical protein